MINGYGPTETTVGATSGECLAGERRKPPIGRPFANVEVYLLDNHLEPVPPGMPGEIFIGGVGVGRGYLNRPELTAERFLPDRFGRRSGGKIYRTGDLARRRADGQLEYLGRIDQQVKIRGFRIELAEIEAALSEHTVVRDAAVVVREQEMGEKRLVAYLAIGEDAAPTTSELYQFLKERLPSHMIPAAFVTLAKLPLSPTGKVDRAALPAVEGSRPALRQNYVAPRTDNEVALAHIWSQVLNIERVGIHDNFFEIGGDSLLSIQVIARAARAGLRLTPRQLFEQQTIAEQALVAVALPMSDAQQAAVTGPVGLTPIQHWFFEQRLVKPAHFNQAIMLEVGEPLQASLLHEAVAHLVLHHDALRSRFTRDGEIWRQSCAAPTDAIPFHCVDLSHVAADESAAAIEAIAVAEQNDLDLAHGPLMRVCLIDLGSERPSRLLFVIHHLVVDGVSWRILLEDLHLVYQQLSRGESPCLGAKTTSYQEWSRRLVEYANSPALHHESDYWLSLAHVPTRHIPVDFNRATDQVHRDGGTVDQSDVVTVSLTSDETRRLLEEVPRAYRAQMNGVLLAALAQAFHAWMGDASLLVDLEGHGREDLFDDVDLSRTVGWFTSVFPVHLHLENAGDPQETIAAIETMLQKVPWRGVGFGMLKYLGDDASVSAALARLPSPEVSFNYLGQTDQLRSAGGRLRMASESTGAVRDGQQLRKHLLEINALVVEGQLRIDWTFSHAWHQRQTIENVAQAFIDAIQGTIAGCHDTASTISDRLAAYVAPRNALEAELTQWCERQLGQSPIGSEDDLSLLAHNPLTARECLASFALHHKLAVPPSDAEGASTVADLASIVRRAANRARRSPLTTIRGRGTKAPLFCVHPAGGSVFPYYALAHHLGADQPVYALEARGLAGHESCHETVQAMARDYIHALREVQPTGPFYLAGWSFGGLVAYEMARQLKLAQEQVPLVVLIDTQVAHDDSTDTGDDAFAALLAMFPTVEQVSPEEMRQLSRSDKIAIFARQVEGAGLIQRGADRWEVERQFEVFESTCRAWLDFRPAPYTGNVSLFLAQERPRDQQQEVASLWQLCIDGALRVRNMPGDHLTMMREPNVRELARHLTRHLAWANRKLEAAEAGSSISPLRAETSRDIDPDLSMLS